MCFSKMFFSKVMCAGYTIKNKLKNKNRKKHCSIITPLEVRRVTVKLTVSIFLLNLLLYSGYKDNYTGFFITVVNKMLLVE